MVRVKEGGQAPEEPTHRFVSVSWTLPKPELDTNVDESLTPPPNTHCKKNLTAPSVYGAAPPVLGDEQDFERGCEENSEQKQLWTIRTQSREHHREKLVKKFEKLNRKKNDTSNGLVTMTTKPKFWLKKDKIITQIEIVIQTLPVVEAEEVTHETYSILNKSANYSQRTSREKKTQETQPL